MVDLTKLIQLLYFTLLFSSGCFGMKVVKSVDLRPNAGEIPNAEYIARFAIDQDANLHASARVKLEGSYNPSLNLPVFIDLISDEDWEKVLHGNNCDLVSQYSKFKIPQTLRGDGEWSKWELIEQQNFPSVQVWYAVISDCVGATHQANPSMPNVEVEIHMLNSGSEFSHEEKGIVTLHIILFVVYAYFLLTTTYKIVMQALNKETVEMSLMACVFAIYMELLCIIAQTIHLYIYSLNGAGFFLLDLASTVLQMNSQVIIVGILIMIAHGWLITDTDLSKNNKLVSLGVVACIIQSCATFLTIIDDGAHHKYHDYGGFQGFVLVMLRLFLYFTFVFGICTHIGRVNRKAKSFLKAMSVAGSLYMMAFPILWFICFIVPADLRNRLIVFGNMGVQLLAIIILLNQLSKKGSRFEELAESSKNVFPKKGKFERIS